MKDIFFDLDGTLLSIDIEKFMELYLSGIGRVAQEQGFDAHVVTESLLQGTYAMVRNDGTQSNEQVFWDRFAVCSGISKEQAEPMFDTYYSRDFDLTGAAAAPFAETAAMVSLLKNKGYRLYLTTNPLFPRIAIEKRAVWGGLDLADFEIATTFDQCHYCKPNPLFYAEIAERFGLDIKEVLLIGNDAREDAQAIQSLGGRCILTTEELINTKQLDITCELKTHPELLAWVRELPQV